ncbi:MAG: GxxExxY protein [Planctomycetota bacterium]
MNAQQLNANSGEVVDAAVDIHQELGPGLLESVYEVVLAREVERRGFRVRRQVVVPIEFRGVRFDEGFRLDLIVEDAVVVEIKSIEVIKDVHKKQLLTYLRLMNRRLGLLLNFNTTLMKDGITRTVNNLPES